MKELGKVYRDTISGYTGTATGRAEYLHDTPSLQLTRADSSGKPESCWIAEIRCEPVNATKELGFGSTVEPDCDPS